MVKIAAEVAKYDGFMSTRRNDFHNLRVEKKIHRTVEHNLRAQRMVENGDAVLVGVSGGPDSVALVHILLAFAPAYSLRIAIAHLNHCLRQNESDRDEAFVTELAKRLELPIHVERQDVRRYQLRHHLSPEEAAREVRYRFYHDIAARFGYDKIALGHQADDNAELILMGLLRGSGPEGLSGMRPVRGDKIVRPLINVQRSQIMNYIAAKELDYIEDSSNRDLQFLRNKIRHRLIPELKAEYNPKVTVSLNRLAAILDAEHQMIENLIQPIFEKAVIFEKQGSLGLSIAELNQQPLAVKRRLIRKAILRIKGNLRRIAFVHIEAVVRLAEEGSRARILDLADRIRIRRDNGILYVSREERSLRHRASAPYLPTMPAYRYQLAEPGAISIKEAAVQICFSEIPKDNVIDWHQSDQRIVFLDMEKIRFPLVIRSFCPGDRFSPLGMSGSQKLKKFFIDHKIGRAERASCPIVLSRDKIVWVAGYRLDHSVRITPRTRRILKAELLLA
ncbi:MAG: tRNA lysidine(34) synthetase TilS [Desulfobacterales bacterium]